MDNQGKGIYEPSKLFLDKLLFFEADLLDSNKFLSFNPIDKSPPNQDISKLKKSENFFDKYNQANSQNTIFYLEEELVEQIKKNFSTGNPYIYDKTKIYQDDFFNEENVLSNILGDLYIKNSYTISIFGLIFFVIQELEKQMFDTILIQQITNESDKIYYGLKAPLLKNGFIELLIKNDIEEKLNIMYKDNSIGYAYIAEKLITYDLFIIYVILKNYPFFVMTRNRLEKLFNLLKKYKSFPYPIGSIGMDLFKLLINELYLPGVTLLQEIRSIYFLDIIDPKMGELDCNDFIKVISFDDTIFKNYSQYSLNEEILITKLSDYKNLTFTSLVVYIAYILYNSEDKKENEREEQYLDGILALFEKRLKQKKDNKYEENKENFQVNISEKNIINNVFNLIDNGLDSNFLIFSKEVKTINDKLISKAKEIHETTTSKPRENINLRKFLYHKIYHKTLKGLPPDLKDSKIYKFEDLEEEREELPLKTNEEEKENENNVEEIEDKDLILARENIKKIDKYRRQLEFESNFNGDEIINDYVDNFLNLKSKYFSHLQFFDINKYRFSEPKDKEEVLQYNREVKIKEKQLAYNYSQKYIVKEDQLLSFIERLDYWKDNINSIYHSRLFQQTKFEKEDNRKINDSKKKKGHRNTDEKERLNVQNLTLEKQELENLINKKLPFNYKLYLIPSNEGFSSLSKFISKHDFLYKTIIGDFFLDYPKNLSEKEKSVTDIPLQLYLTEAKHNFNLKVFKAITKTHLLYLYGSIHICADNEVILTLDGEEDKRLIFKNNYAKIYIDIINLYSENDKNESIKINDIEKYLIDSTDNYFQIFISGKQEKTNQIIKDNQREEYFKKFVINMMNFDVNTLNYQARRIRIESSHDMKIDSVYVNLDIYSNLFEISFDKIESNEWLGSFTIPITTFLDLRK